MLHKVTAAAQAALIALVASAPDQLHRAAIVALWFIATDTVTGVLAARARRRTSSSAFRRKMLSKLGCYLGILMFAAGIAFWGRNWDWVVYAWYAIAGAEGLSIQENLRVMLRAAGPSMQPLAALLERFVGLPEMQQALGQGKQQQQQSDEPDADGE